MRLLINLCSHDGIISHYNGVGTMTISYIKKLKSILNGKMDYHINLFTPEYNENSFGFDNKIYLNHKKDKNITIFKVSNNSNGKINYGNYKHWEVLCNNTSKIINNLDNSKYDKVITICNDTPYACLPEFLNNNQNHIKVVILHSTVKIHKVDSALKKEEQFYNQRLKWEQRSINYINKNNNVYAGVIGKFINNHLISEYKLNEDKAINIFNGPVKYKNKYSKESLRLLNGINKYKEIVLSFGRAESYKNLESCFIIGQNLNIKPIVIAQLYYKSQPIKKEYEKYAKETNGILYIDPPFDFAHCILNKYKGKIICLIPSYKEIMGLVVNEVRILKRNNILVVANNIDGIKEQIEDKKDALLVDLNDINKSVNKIKKYYNSKSMKKLTALGYKKVKKEYCLKKNIENFLKELEVI